jgi:hypothetical protein
VRGVTFIYVVHVGHSTRADHGWRLDPSGILGACHRRFLALMMGAPGSTALAPPMGMLLMFVMLMVGTRRCTAVAPPRRLNIDVCYVDDGRSRISISTHQGAHRRRFFALMVGAPGCTALAPSRGPSSTFVMLMMGLLDLYQHPPRGSPSMFLSVEGGRS